MRQSLLILTLVLCYLSVFSKIEPVEGIEPSGTLPVLYINTENAQEIDQKENYIDGEWWLGTYGIEGFESIGSAEEPQKLGIKGRGNTSWIHDGQKPYKLKLDKKSSLLGMKKNKHWALLARLKSYCLYNELLAFEIGKQLGMDYVPSLQPVEVVLNNTYIGLYMLTETIRIDDNRLEIYEQPEFNEDLETIDAGWLVELDNNTEVNQVSIPQPQGYNLRVTHKTPENVNDLQRDWLIDQITSITEAINTDNLYNRDWEDYIDMEALVKHLIVQECLTNYDAYLGSCYMHKDIDSKWMFGPLWDFSASGYVYKSHLIAESSNQHWIGEFYKFPRFKKLLREKWNEYYDQNGTEWIEPLLDDFYNKIKDAVTQSVMVWPDTPIDADEGLQLIKKTIRTAFNYLNKVYNEECITYNIDYQMICDDLSFGSDVIPYPIVRIGDQDYSSVDVLQNSTVKIDIEINPKISLDKILINDEEFLIDNHNESLEMTLDDITEDKELKIYFSLNNEDTGVENILANPGSKFSIYTTDGLLIRKECPVNEFKTLPKGIYIIVSGKDHYKISL